VSARRIEAGELIAADMLLSRRGPLERLPRDSVLRAEQIVGRQASRGFAKGAVLALGNFREPWLVERNRPVLLRAQGVGFNLSRDGKALDNGSLGSTVRVLSADGRMLSAQPAKPLP
jgi:flagella basal body P-ring formation protein FlgA